MSEIEACRTCGIFFLVASNFLRHLHGNDAEMENVRRELEAWKVKLNEDERFPQYICTVCLLEFRKIFKFQSACLETQEQLRQLYDLQEKNIKNIQIKSEISDDMDVKPEPQTVPAYNAPNGEPNVCAFIYLDDLSDSEYDKETETNNTPQFKVPHIPLKQEIIEEARVPDFEQHNLNAIDGENEEDQDMSMPALTSDLPNEHEEEIPNYESMESTEDMTESCLPISENDGIQCELCLHVSVDHQEHRQHILRIHESKPFECHICGKEFNAGTSQTRFKYHLKWHRLNKHIKCPQCGFHCASRDVLNEHTRAVHTKSPCQICGKRFTPKKMRSHMEKHQRSESASTTPPCFECDYCRIEFTNQLELDQHVLMSHNDNMTENTNIDSLTQDEPPQEDMIESGNETETSSTSTGTSIMSFSPDDNPDNATMPLYFSSHEESSHYETNQDDSYETTLENEMSTTNFTTPLLEEMQFTCAKCPLSFPRVEQLIAHTEVHDDKSLFHCTICGKKFDLKFSLNRHMKRHKNLTF